jgi:Na+/H+ antiporter NhaD/arsenite permease-like protein
MPPERDEPGSRRSRRRVLLLMLLLLVAAGLWGGTTPLYAAAAAEEAAGATIGELLPLWSIVPFVGILLSIAIFPLVAPHFWHKHYPKVAFAWALLFAVPFLLVYRVAAHEILHIYLVDYLPFIILLWGLFTVAGGIVLRGTLVGTPIVNTGFLLVGTVIASWAGTTGAAMLLIRPLLRANAHRAHKTHVVVFFLFLVANIGGSLTPLGDPPLFLGFLHKVPFTWTFNLLPHMAFMSFALLILFYRIDHYYFRKEGGAAALPAQDSERQPLRLEGSFNLTFLAGILAAVMMSGIWHAGSFTVHGVHLEWQNIVRDLLIVAMGGLSLLFTSSELRKANEFSWEPIREVAYLFAGIFMTIIPALAILKAGEQGALAFLVAMVQEPWHYFVAVGGLSAFLDNAPTYLTFFNTVLGRFYPGQDEAAAVARLIAENAEYLEAISVGAVFMGAMTYIGNAPNFMVKSIAEEAGIAMPSFFGFMLRWSIPILVPLFIAVGWIFF